MSVPAEIGPYRVVRPLGRGGMGAVYLAEDSRLHRQVALKVFTRGNARGELARLELMTEARAAASLNHQHIASVHDVLDIDGQVAIVFEYVEGDTLAHRLYRGPLEADETIRLSLQLVDALAAAHQRGVVHRDLKPANIAITRDGNVKVLDFGVARTMPAGADDASKAQTTAAWFVGTVGYAAPEQCLGQSVDVRADIFSLGVLMFEMLSGRRPFKGTDASVVLRSMLSDIPPRVGSTVGGVPGDLEELIARMLSPDPGQRPQTAADVGAALRGLLPTTRFQIAPVRPRRRGWMAAAVIATAAVTGAVVSPLVLNRASGSASIRTDRPPVVAILPLTNASGDPAKEYLAIGVAESLVTRLARVPSVTVLSRATLIDARRRSADIPTLARELDVTYFVDGSVQEMATVLRINLNLVSRDGAVLWAETVEGPFSSIFVLQARLSSALSHAMAVRVSAADRADFAITGTSNPDALAAYWRGRTFLDRRDISGNTERALDSFRDAVRLDPRFADAHAALGEAYWALYRETLDPELPVKAIDAGTEALRLAPDRPHVRYALAVTLEGSGRMAEAIEELERSLALQPNYDDARRRLGQILASQGRLDEASAEFRKAIELRPSFWGHYSALGVTLFQAARYEEAIEAFTQVTRLQPDSPFGFQQLGAVYQATGDYDAALEQFKRANSIRPLAQSYSGIGAVLHQRGDYAGAVDAYTKALEIRPNSHITKRNLGDSLRRLDRRAAADAAYKEAVALAEAELAVNPRDARTMAYLAVYLAKLQRPSSEERIRTALSLSPTDVQVVYRSAVVHALLGREDEAMGALAEAVRLGYSRAAAATDEDLSGLRRLPAFRSLVNQAY